MKYDLRRIIIGAILLVCCGCDSRDLIDNLTQRQAREIVAYLSGQGIEASPYNSGNARGNYVVRVPESKYRDAIVLLEREHLPHPDKPSVDDLLAPAGIFPQSREIEQLRLDRIYAAEIEELLSHYQGVTEVRSVVRVHSANGANMQPGVSVHVITDGKHEVTSSVLIDQIQRVVPGISRDKISVMSEGRDISRSQREEEALLQGETFLGIARVNRADIKNLSLAFTMCLVLYAVGGGVLGYYVGMVRRMGKNSTKSSARGGQTFSASPEELFPRTPGGEL